MEYPFDFGGCLAYTYELRAEKLADAGLITTRKGHTDTDRIPPTVATLTDDSQ